MHRSPRGWSRRQPASSSAEADPRRAACARSCCAWVSALPGRGLRPGGRTFSSDPPVASRRPRLDVLLLDPGRDKQPCGLALVPAAACAAGRARGRALRALQGDGLPQRVAHELLVAGGPPMAARALEGVLEADPGVEVDALGVLQDGPAPASSPCSRIGAGVGPSAVRMRSASATATSGSVTVTSATTRTVPGGRPACLSCTASPEVHTPSSTPIPTSLRATHTRCHPRSWTLTDATSGRACVGNRPQPL